MIPQSLSDLLAFAIGAKDAGNVAEARAAAQAAIRLASGEAAPWLLLLEIDTTAARWEDVLASSAAAAARHPDNVDVAMYRPRALRYLSRRLEAMAELQRIARDYPRSIEALDLLAETAWPFDPAMCLEAAEQAVERGLSGRDYLAARGVEAAALIGAFRRGKAVIAAMTDRSARDRAAQKLAHEEASWHQHARDYDARLAAGAPLTPWELIDAGEMDLARYAATRRLLERCPAAEHEAIIAACHRLGHAGVPLLVWASFSARRHEDRPSALLHYIDVLLSTGDFVDAGAMLRRIAGAPGLADDILRRQTFCCACGGLDRETLVRTLLSATGAGKTTRALARAFLVNERPAVGVGSDPDAHDPRAAVLASRDTVDAAHAARLFFVPGRAAKPRVALCISGQLRSFRQTWPETRRAFERWDPVVFVSTWAGVGAGFGAHDTVERCLPPAVRDRLPAELRRRSLFESLLPRTAAVLAASDEVTVEELQEFYGTPFVRVHDEAAFEERHRDTPGLHYGPSLNQAKMFFTLWDALAVRADFEIRTFRLFDAVVRVRPDRAITYVGDRDIETVATSRTILSDYFMPGAIGDQGMMCGSEVADRLSEIWPKMQDAGDTRFFPGSRGMFNEFLIAEYMMHSGVRMGKFLNTHSMGLTPIAAPVAPLWRAVAEDYARQAAPSPDVEAVFVAFCEAAAEEHDAGGNVALLHPLPAIVGRGAPALTERGRRFLDAAARG